MVERWKVKIPALTGEKERTAYVYLPMGYFDSEECYPVLYMFDGHNLFTDEEATFGKCWGLSRYLDEHGVKVIVAAVECNHEGNSRLSEYSPTDFVFHGEKIKGNGKKYMDWLVGTFKPYIDFNFRTLTQRSHTFIAGSSMGGLMTIYALANYNMYFGGGAALSPSLWVGGEDMPQFIKTGKFGKDSVLYMDYGSKEFANHFRQRDKFCLTYTALVKKGVFVTARVVPFGEHCEASWEKQIPIFLKVFGL
jgi:predicted alpha/beta superfamily hydrolase